MIFGLATYAVIKSITLFVHWLTGVKMSPVLGDDPKSGFRDPVQGQPKSPFVKRGKRRARDGRGLGNGFDRDDDNHSYGLDVDDAELIDDETVGPEDAVGGTSADEDAAERELAQYQNSSSHTNGKAPVQIKKQSSFKGKQRRNTGDKLTFAVVSKPSSSYGSTSGV